MSQVQFENPCYFEGKKFGTESTYDESTIDSKWLAGMIKQKAARMVLAQIPTPTPGPVDPPTPTPTPTPAELPATV